MTNPIDPTPDDLRRWAYTPDAENPDEMSQDWDLCVADIERAALLVEFASDAACPNRGFFLTCLYILAGDCVRLARCRQDIPRLVDVMRGIPQDAPKEVRVWVDRATYLIEHPECFEFGKVGLG